MKTTLLKKYIVPALPLLAFAFIALTMTAPQAQAASLENWNAGRIIDDGVFTNNASMDVATIQAFLNSKVPVCDTNGTQTSEFGGGTRAQWGQAHYGQSTFTCLKDYRENNASAAEIIYAKAQEFKINPQVLLVLLQKEQGLVTDTWPLNVQYRTATGYGCPDTAACDSQYFGLTNQLTWSARMFRAIMNASPTWYTPYVEGNNFIRYSPDSSCGGSDVYIQNRATQALYNYTPYQPNQGALAVGYGTAYCGAYGNRNFYLYFVDWFGSTVLFNGTVTITSPFTTTQPTPLYPGNTVSATYTVSNSASYPVDVGGLGICGRLNGVNFDFGFQHHVTIPPNSSTTISYSRQVDTPGSLRLFVCSYNEQLGWASDYYPSAPGGLARETTLKILDNPVITSGVTFSPASPAIGQPVTATMTIRNHSSTPTTINTVVVAARDAQGNNVDFAPDSNLTIPASTTYTYTKTKTFTAVGDYSFFVAGVYNSLWSTDYPKSIDGSIVRRGNFTVQDNPLITSGVTFSPASPAIGQPVTATMTIRNASASPINIGLIVAAARDPQGNNVDFAPDSNLTIPASTTYTYTKTRTFTTPGNYSFFIANLQGSTWNKNYPKSADASIVRQGALIVQDNPLVISGINLTPANPLVNQAVTATMSIRNNSADPVSFSTLVIAGRSPNGVNVDFPADQDLVIPANTTYVYTKTRTFTTPGNYSFFIASLKNGVWSTSNPKSSDGSVVRQLNVPVQ